MNACEKDCNKCKSCKILHKKPVKSVKSVKSVNQPVPQYQPIMYASSQIGAAPSILQQLLDFQKVNQVPLERMQSSSALNPSQIYQEVRPLAVSPEYIRPNPTVDNIVKEQNSIKQLSKSLEPLSIPPSPAPYLGFSTNRAVNDLNMKVANSVFATKDFGGLDAYPDSPGTVLESSIGYTKYRQPLTDAEIQGLDFYYIQKNNKNNRKKFDTEDKEMYNLGKKVSNNKSSHPEVIQYKLNK